MELNTMYTQSDIRKAVTGTYMWMALGLLITAAVAIAAVASGLMLRLLYAVPYAMMILAIAQLAVVFGFSAAMRKAQDASLMRILFIVYSVLTGLTFSSLAYVYDLGTIGVAFLITAVYFICLAVVGTTTTMDLTKIGNICMVGLIALIITQIIMLFFPVSGMTRIMSIIGLVIFTGLTAWDIQRMNQLLVMEDGNPVGQDKVSIFMALQLYLDFINIFLRVLRLLSKKD
ncbi:MAG: Bax inhibitor-1/YccA family protein [Faecalicoccus sp.]|nr:Bax inhibitor-1/YccA family protein [Faecalicoccus sp.]